MESLFLVNPRKRKRKGRMPPGLKRYWASRRRVKGKRLRRRKARSVMANPRRRRRRRNPVVRSYRRRRARHRNPRRRHRHHARHRNPFKLGSLKATLIPAAIGAGGAIALSVVYNKVAPSLPATLQTGYLPALVKAAAAIGLGMLAGKFLGREQGKYVTLGGLTVVIVGVVQPMIANAVPSLGLSGVGDYIPYTRPGVGAYMRNPGKFGAYLTKPMPGMKGLGFMSPAAVIQPAKNANMGDWQGWQGDGM